MEEDIVMHEQELLFAIDDDLSRQASNAVKLSPAISNLSPPAGDATPSRRSNQSRRSKPSFSTSRTIEGGRGSRGANRQVGIGVEHYPVVDEETGAKADDVVEVRYVSEAEEKRRYFAAWDDDDDDFLGGFSLVGGGTNSTTTSPGIDHQHRDHEEHYLEAGSPILAPPSGGMVMEDLEDLF
ncbi:unnamed protein product [Amoebophrya sp. A25]|nr:unnamed protein product [Amoebophrya sp. A25]|eukprot:GSA25T00022450001.1